MPAPACLTPVHPPETNPQYRQECTPWGFLVTSDDPSVRFRHSGWVRTRAAVCEAMEIARATPRQLTRFALCGSDPWVIADPDDPTRLSIAANYCHSRWCIPCARTRAHTIATNLTRLCKKETVRFITLTLKHATTPLRVQLDRLYSCFRELRRTQLWKKKVTGGAAVLEVSFARTSHAWHPHLHVLCNGNYIPNDALSAAWLKATGDSFVVDVRLVRDNYRIAGYVAKYVTKSIPPAICNDPERLADLIGACRNRRLVLTFGTWRGFKLSEKLDTTAWKNIGPLPDVLRDAKAGVWTARVQIDALRQKYAELIAVHERSPPDEPPEP